MEDKVLYTFTDKFGEISKLTLDKFVAEILQKILGNVHEWIQKKYNELIIINNDSSRRHIGDLIRDEAIMFWNTHTERPADF